MKIGDNRNTKGLQCDCMVILRRLLTDIQQESLPVVGKPHCACQQRDGISPMYREKGTHIKRGGGVVTAQPPSLKPYGQRPLPLPPSPLFFLKIFGGHMSFLWGHWYPCFGLLVMSALGFKARVDSLACFLACVLFLGFTSGATPADLLMASMAAEPLCPTYLQPSDVSTSIGGIEVRAMARTYGLGQGSNPQPTVPQHSALNHSTIPARLFPTLPNTWALNTWPPSSLLSFPLSSTYFSRMSRISHKVLVF